VPDHTILQAMTLAEAIETTRIHLVAGLTGDRTAWVTARPCRAPHHTISDVGLIGGGYVPLLGEVSLAHNGVLFLDEWPEFRLHVLEVLWQPLEESVIYIQSRGRPRSHHAGRPGRVGSDTPRVTSPESHGAIAISQTCHSTGCWLSLFVLQPDVSAASVRNGDQSVHPCTATESAIHSPGWPRHFPALPLGMYTAAQPFQAA
jgi:Magnesium chelatase, subunit ChlI